MTSALSPRPIPAPQAIPAPQGWAVVAAWVAALANVPAACWRIAMLTGLVPHHLAAFYRASFGRAAYVLGLDLVQVLAGVLTLGLVQPWGERLWRWVPGIGGRRIPWRLVVAVASIGCVAASVIVYGVAIQMTQRFASGRPTPMSGEHGWRLWLWAVCYLPVLAWPAALAVAIVGFVQRHRTRHIGIGSTSVTGA